MFTTEIAVRRSVVPVFIALAAAMPYTADAAQANLRISKGDRTDYVERGATTTYVITVNNYGPDAADGVTVSDPVPAGLVSCAWTCTGVRGALCGSGGSGDITDAVSIPANAFVQYLSTCTIDPSANDAIVNVASFFAPIDLNIGVHGYVAQDTNWIIGEVDLAITLEDPNQWTGVQPGWPFWQTVTAENRGTQLIGGVTVKAEFPFSTQWQCTGRGGATCPVARGNGTIWQTVTLPGGASLDYRALSTVFSGMTDPIYTRAKIFTSGSLTVDYDLNNNAVAIVTPVITAQNTDLVLSLDSAQARAAAGDPIEYELRVRNDGAVTANAQVNMLHSRYLDWMTWTCGATGGATCGTGSFDAFEGQFKHDMTLPPGAEATIVLSSWVRQGAGGRNERVLESATVHAPGLNDPVPQNNVAEFETGISVFVDSFDD